MSSKLGAEAEDQAAQPQETAAESAAETPEAHPTGAGAGSEASTSEDKGQPVAAAAEAQPAAKPKRKKAARLQAAAQLNDWNDVPTGKQRKAAKAAAPAELLRPAAAEPAAKPKASLTMGFHLLGCLLSCRC